MVHTVSHANQKGSAGGMEPVGLYHMFERSDATRGLYSRYVDFYGDGGFKSHATMKDMYRHKSVRKLECIGHIQKCVGCRSWKMNKTVCG